MKQDILISIKMTIAMLMMCCVIYFGIVYLIGLLTPGKGGGEKVMVNGKIVGYELIGQKFTSDKYFWGRPSAVDYNAAGSGGSNKGPSNPDYLKQVHDRLDSFLAHNPSVKKEEVPAEMVTASGSGLDPHISPASARIQVKRIAAVRNISEEKLLGLIDENTHRPWFGPSTVHVLRLNISLDKLSANKQ
jgi:K+-transporting ATPase ATPase C chain